MSAVNTKAGAAGTRKPAARRRQPLVTSRDILVAATAEFAANGLAGARVDAIAERAGVNKRMLYHYYGNKEALWLAVLEEAYAGIRGEERLLDLDHLPPVEGMRRLVEFTVGYNSKHPEFAALLNSENVHRAKYLRRSKKMRELHTSLLGLIGNLLDRGTREGVFRAGVDPAELYITSAALGFFYYSNIHTLSAIFGRDLGARAARRRHLAHSVAVILDFLRP